MFLYKLIRKELERLGADGLVNMNAGCSCPLEDLAPLDGCPNLRDCRPAQKKSCENCKKTQECEWLEFEGEGIAEVEACFVPLEEVT